MVLSRIKNVMNVYPILAPIVSAGILTFVGDSIAQQIVEQKTLRNHDWRRTLNQTIYGLFIIGPASCFWFRFLEANVNPQNPILRTGLRVIFDQLLFTPVFLAVYFAYNTIAEGHMSHGEIKDRILCNYLPALKSNYKLWPAVQCINFYMIPINFRILFVNCIALGWTAYLSNLNARGGTMMLKPEI